MRLGNPDSPTKDVLLFSNPASTKREKMTIRVSHDGGRTWPASVSIHGGPSAYSALAVLPGQTVGCLYERGESSPYDKITFARIPLQRLLGSE